MCENLVRFLRIEIGRKWISDQHLYQEGKSGRLAPRLRRIKKLYTLFRF
jgi:hypothetical protein